MGDTGAAFVAEATRRARLVWLALPDLPYPRAAWHVWHDGAAYVLTGGIEQPLPGLPEAERVTVTVPAEGSGGRLVSWVAEVARVGPHGAEWRAVLPVLARRRLNAPDGAERTERWDREVYILRLTPTGEVTEEPGSMPTEPATVRPVDTPATTSGPPPRTRGGKRRRADR